MRMSGADFKAFMQDNNPKYWPVEMCFDEEVLRVNGVEAELNDINSYKEDDVIEIIAGTFYWEDLDKKDKALPRSLKALASKWLNDRGLIRLIISVPLDKFDDLVEAIKPIGAKLCKD